MATSKSLDSTTLIVNDTGDKPWSANEAVNIKKIIDTVELKVLTNTLSGTRLNTTNNKVADALGVNSRVMALTHIFG